MVGSKLVSNGVIFLCNTPVHMQLVIFLLLYNVSELSIRIKGQKF